MARIAMTTRLAALAREKEVLLMRSALGRLRLRLAAERVRGSARAATRLAAIVAAGRFLLGLRRRGATVRYRTDVGAPSPYPRVSTKEQSK